MHTDPSEVFYTTIISEGTLPEVLPGESRRAYPTPEDAIHHGGLWRRSVSQRLIRVIPVGEITHVADSPAITADAFEVLGLSNVDGPLYSLSRAFGTIADEMYVEQAAWRRALMRPLNKPELVHELLEKTLEFRGLELWTVQRLDSVEEVEQHRDLEGMYSWAVIFAQTAFEIWRDASVDNSYLDYALRVGWSTWFDSNYWDDPEYAANPDPNTSIDWISWDAWAALTIFYTANQHLIDFPSDLLTKHYRDAYQNGLKAAAPIGQGILGYCV